MRNFFPNDFSQRLLSTTSLNDFSPGHYLVRWVRVKFSLGVRVSGMIRVRVDVGVRVSNLLGSVRV